MAGNTVGEATIKLSFDGKSLDSSTKEASNKLSAWTVAAGNLISTGISKALGAIKSFATESINVGKNFDSSMSQVAATMGKTTSEITQLRDFAKEMGATTAFSANQAADALNYMALAGYDADTSMAMLPKVLNLAAAGSIDLARASDMVTDAQSALGLTMDQTDTMIDQMAKTSSKTNTSVAQLGDAILTVGGTAKNLAGGTNELNMMLGVLADNGVKGAEGGTALRNIILSLSAPTSKAAEAIKKLGLDVFDAEGNMRPLNETFGDLQTILGDMTQQQQTEVLNTIFNKVDLKSVNALLGTSAERFAELGVEIDNAQGAAQKMADTQLDNLEGDVTLFKSALEGAQIAISDGVTPQLRELTQFGTEAITKLSEAFKDGGLTGAMDALGTILGDGLNMVISYLPSFIEGGVNLVLGLANSILDNMPSVIQALVDCFPALLNGAIELFMALVEAIPTIIDALVEAMPSILETLVNTLTSPEFLTRLLDAAIQLLMAIVHAIPQMLITLIDTLPTILTNIVLWLVSPQTIMTLMQAAIELFFALVQAVPQILGALIGAFGTLVGNLWNGIVSMFSEFAGNFGNMIGNIFKTAINGVIGFIENFVNLPINVINGFIGVINNAFGWIGVHIGSIPRVNLPRLAEGGIVDQGTAAIIGEAGKEAVIPLENNTDGWSGLLAETLLDAMDDRGAEQAKEITIVNNITVSNDYDAQRLSDMMVRQIRRAA